MTVAPPPSTPSLGARLTAEGFGAFLIVFVGVGTALFAANLAAEPSAVIVLQLTVSLAFGFALVAAFGAFASISGGHFNPAITLGAAAAGRLPWREAVPYIVAQVVGAVIASTALILVGLFGPAGWLEGVQDAGFAGTGWDRLSPARFEMPAVIVSEVIFTVLLVLVYLRVTDRVRGTAAPGIAVGLLFAAIQFAAIPIANGAANPARSIATALYGGIDPLVQLWVFLVFPAIGAAAIGVAHRALFDGAVPADEAGSAGISRR